jgi:hypothetical protein
VAFWRAWSGFVERLEGDTMGRPLRFFELLATTTDLTSNESRKLNNKQQVH